jgi:hypothetical protein
LRSRDGLPDYETGAAVFLWNKCFHTEGVYSGGGREVRWCVHRHVCGSR